MKLEKSAEKLKKYFGRFDNGKAAKIKIDHVDRVLLKLKEKRGKVAQEHEEAEHKKKKDRLKRKLAVIDDQIKRAEWLRDQIGGNAD